MDDLLVGTLKTNIAAMATAREQLLVAARFDRSAARAVDHANAAAALAHRIAYAEMVLEVREERK